MASREIKNLDEIKILNFAITIPEYLDLLNDVK